MDVRPLPSALQKKAEDELNEVPSRIQEDLDHIKDWIKKQPHLNARMDDQWLLSFLRGCKFSLQKTKEKLDLYYTMKTLVPEFYGNRDPLLPEIQEILKRSHVTVLPKTKDQTGPRVVIIRHKSEKLTFIGHMKVILMMLDILMLEDDNCIVAGQNVIFDLEQISYKYMTQMTPSMLQKSSICMQTSYPTRPKAVHFINTPSVFAAIYNIFKPFLTEKLQSRINFYDGTNFENMYKSIPLSILPQEYGGEEISVDEIAAEWKLKLESYRDWFLEDAAFGTDESKRPGKPHTSADMFGVEGSFRKLNID